MSAKGSAERADVVVIGGGVIGLSVAFELLRQSPERYGRTIVLERDRVGGGATQASAGMIAPMSEAEVQSRAVVDLGLDSLHRYADFVGSIEQVSGVGCGYRRDGTLWAAADADEMRELEHVQALQADKGVTSQLLSARELLTREPHLSSRVVGGLRIDLDHHIDPRRFNRSLAVAVGKLGGQVRELNPARRIERQGDGWIVTGNGPGGDSWRIDCREVVLAAGSWSETEIESPAPHVGLRPIKGQALRLVQGSPRVLQHVIRSPKVYFVPADDGALFVGATAEEQGFDPSATAGATLDLLRYGWRLLPAIYDMQLAEHVVGFRPCLRDHQPAIGPYARADLAGLQLAVGHYRDGILLAPATAHYLAQAMAEGQVPAALEPFAPERLLSVG